MATRKKPDEGHMRLREDGRYEIIVSRGYSDDGKRKQKSFYGTNEKEVIAKYEKYKKDLADGLNVDVDYLFEDWANIWYENHRFNISPTTQQHYKYTLRVLKEAFGKRHIADIKAYDIEKFLNNLRKNGASDSRITHCRAMLFQILHKAEANDFIRKNPVPFVEKMRKKGPSKRKESFTAEEVKTLLKFLPDDRIGWSIRLLLGTGMRTQELLALEPRHIKSDGSSILIEQAINMVKGTAVVGVPKSRDSYRCIPVPRSIRWCAINLRNTDATYIWEMKKKDCPCNPSAFREHYMRALEAVPDVRVLTPHSCRHTFVSQMQALGVDLQTIQSICGHADIDMTEHYLHVQESIRQKATELFDEEFAPYGEFNGPESPTDGFGKVLHFSSVEQTNSPIENIEYYIP